MNPILAALTAVASLILMTIGYVKQKYLLILLILPFFCIAIVWLYVSYFPGNSRSTYEDDDTVEDEKNEPEQKSESLEIFDNVATVLAVSVAVATTAAAVFESDPDLIAEDLFPSLDYYDPPSAVGHKQSSRDALRRILGAMQDLPTFDGIRVGGPDTVGHLGDTPLHIVASWGDVAAVKALIKAGAKINAVDCEGYTPLHEALEHDHVSVARILLYSGADDQIVNKGNLTARDLAKLSANPEIRGLFRESDNDGPSMTD